MLPSLVGGTQGSMDGVIGGVRSGRDSELGSGEGESSGKVSGPGVVFLARGGDREGRKEIFGANLSMKHGVEGCLVS